MPDTRQQVNRVLLITLFLNLAVALGKIITGYSIGALSITADGFHSLADGTSNIVALIANTIAGTPPDADHPYGHQRFETLAALGIGILLMLTAWETIQSVIERLQGGEPPQLTAGAFIVMTATLLVNIAVNRYQVGQGKRLKSEILLADAANTGTDIFVTLSVIISMGVMVAFGWYWADIAAALIVVVLIARAAWQIVTRTGSVLVDTAPFSPEKLTSIVLEVPAITGVTRARSRGGADNAYIDLDVEVSPETTAERNAVTASVLVDKIKSELSGVSEVNIQFIPAVLSEPDYETVVEASAVAVGLRAHRIHINPTPQGKILEFHVEVVPGQTLSDAHQQVSQLEEGLRYRLPEIIDVVSHIEPASRPAGGETLSEAEIVHQQVMALLEQRFATVHWHDLLLYPQENGMGMTIHAHLPANIPIEDAHNLTGDAERLLRSQLNVLDRITIHTEPFEE